MSLDRIEALQNASEAAQQANRESLAEYKKALNGVCATPNGQFVMRSLIKALGVFEPRRDYSQGLVEFNAKRDVYLGLIRPFLTAEIIRELENG